MEYVTLTEHNTWEGETWRFYIPVQGNEKAIQELKAAIQDTERFHLDADPVDEKFVDRCVKRARDGYHPSDNKLSGTLKLPADLSSVEDEMYKGGIRHMMLTCAQ